MIGVGVEVILNPPVNLVERVGDGVLGNSNRIHCVTRIGRFPVAGRAASRWVCFGYWVFYYV
jgi:hypothetical protein